MTRCVAGLVFICGRNYNSSTKGVGQLGEDLAVSTAWLTDQSISDSFQIERNMIVER